MDTDCTIGDRSYRIALPSGDGPHPAILYLHGYRGSAAGVMNNAAYKDMANAMGVALIAPKSGGEDWLIRNAPRKGFDNDELELSYFDALMDDVTTRHGIDPARVLVTGFSAGGMMVWTLACHRGERFAGFLPVAGTFWDPLPEACPNPPVDLIHIHGTADQVVPPQGRPIADTKQGDVFSALSLFQAAGGYEPTDEGIGAPKDFTCKGALAPEGSRLYLCLHEGGHSISADWLRFGFETLVDSTP
ncbi:MAG: PHB depolymerase family esterase [Pseudomonadota bacterium]